MASQSRVLPRPRGVPRAEATAGASANAVAAADLECSDEVLVLAAKRQRAAFTPLYLRYVDPIYRYCLRRLGSPEAAEDATAHIFTNALAALPRYRDDGPSFRSWLFAIAHNVLVDIDRGRRSVTDLQVAERLADPTPGPEDIVLLADERRLLLAALQLLSPDQRRVMELRLTGLPSTEVATVLSRSPESVRALQLRAVRRLQTLLGIPTAGEEARHG